MRCIRSLVLLPPLLFVTACVSGGSGSSSVTPAAPRDATPATRASNAAVRSALPFGDRTDFELAERGLVARAQSLVVRNDKGRVVWDLDQYAFLTREAPATANPSLWRQSQLLRAHGLYRVTDRVYQVRGYDLSVMSVISGDTGWIVVDPLITSEVAAAAMELVQQHLGPRPVVAMIYTHSHADHFGGAKGVVSAEAVAAGKVRVIAPPGFMEHAIAENILAGNAMSRRASYMYGALLPKGPRGHVGAGLGQSTSAGTITLIPPTELIPEEGGMLTVDGVPMEFMNVPGAEAPAELVFYLPGEKALCVAEEANGTLHNLYTLRGAQVRDGKLWAHWLDAMIDRFGAKLELVFGSHHWPRVGRERAIDFLEKQRDLYKYIHDQTLRLANHGLTMSEIAEELTLPDSLGREFYNRDYYGTVRHNSRAQYQKYLGWFDGNPANLNPLPPAQAAKRYVELMGGADAVLKQARQAFERGEFRWVAQLVNHVVFAEPTNEAARQLQAEALEQLGYQAESGPWRSFYLTGAQELRHGVRTDRPAPNTASPDILGAMSPEMFFDALAVRLNGPKAAGRELRIGLDLAAAGQYLLTVKNAVLHYRSRRAKDTADVSLRIARIDFIRVLLGARTLDDAVQSGAAQVEGDPQVLRDFVALLDRFEFWFDIVTPRAASS